MKIYIIRHAKVNMKWPKMCNSVEFDEACTKYDESDIISPKSDAKDLGITNIYVSKLSRSQDAANCLFPSKKYDIYELLNEVPLKSSMDCNIRLPLFLWMATGRIQWFLNNKRQDETRKCTIKRAEKFAELLLKNAEDAIVVTHGFYMKTLINELQKKGFKIKHNSLRSKNLDVVEAII